MQHTIHYVSKNTNKAYNYMHALLHTDPAGRERPTDDPAVFVIPEQLVQALSDVDAMFSLYFPLSQKVHCAVPIRVLYLPLAQAVHAAPSGPVKPAEHLQSFNESD